MSEAERIEALVALFRRKLEAQPAGALEHAWRIVFRVRHSGVTDDAELEVTS